LSLVQAIHAHNVTAETREAIYNSLLYTFTHGHVRSSSKVWNAHSEGRGCL